jgi:hypothetical protein
MTSPAALLATVGMESRHGLKNRLAHFDGRVLALSDPTFAQIVADKLRTL